jgi:hypothetical protein
MEGKDIYILLVFALLAPLTALLALLMTPN